MYVNSISATILEKAFIPIVLSNDREVVQALVATCWQEDIPFIRLAQVKSILQLGEMILTEPLFQEAHVNLNYSSTYYSERKLSVFFKELPA